MNKTLPVHSAPGPVVVMIIILSSNSSGPNITYQFNFVINHRINFDHVDTYHIHIQHIHKIHHHSQIHRFPIIWMELMTVYCILSEL